jgi:tetratricopeptide (TPR) repeat protein
MMDETLAEAAFRTGDFAEPERRYLAALAAATRDGDKHAEARATGDLGIMHHYRNISQRFDGKTMDEAAITAEEKLMQRALELWQEAGDDAGVATAMFGAGLVHQVLRSDWTAAMPYFWQAFGLAEAVADSGDLYGCSEIHRHIGFYYLVQDVRPAQAARRLGYSLELRERLGDQRLIPSGLVALGHAERARGNPQRALELSRRAVAISREARLLPKWIQHAENALRDAETEADPALLRSTGVCRPHQLHRAGRAHQRVDPAAPCLDGGAVRGRNLPRVRPADATHRGSDPGARQ